MERRNERSKVSLKKKNVDDTANLGTNFLLASIIIITIVITIIIIIMIAIQWKYSATVSTV